MRGRGVCLILVIIVSVIFLLEIDCGIGCVGL